jgi:hypothetical protein
MAALGDREREIHAQSQTFDHRSEMPRVNDAAIDGCLPAHRVEPRTVEKGMPILLDGYSASPRAVRELKADGLLPTDTSYAGQNTCTT